MPSRACPNCARWISEAAPLCERCGQQVRPLRSWHREPLDCSRSPADALIDFFTSRASRRVLLGARTAENVVLTAFEYVRRDPGTFPAEEREKLRRWGQVLLEEEAERVRWAPGEAIARREEDAREFAQMLADALERFHTGPGERRVDEAERLRRERVRRAALALLEALDVSPPAPDLPYGEGLRRVVHHLRGLDLCLHCERMGEACACGGRERDCDADGADPEDWLAEWRWDDNWSEELAGDPVPPARPVVAESRPLASRTRVRRSAGGWGGWREAFRAPGTGPALLADPARREAVRARSLALMAAVSGLEFGPEEYSFEGVLARTVLWAQREPVCLVCGEAEEGCTCPFSRL